MKKRKDGRYQKKITLPNGKSKIVYGATKKEVNEKADKIKLQYAMGRTFLSPDITLEKWTLSWWEHSKKGKTGTKSQDGYKNAINNYILPNLGNMSLEKIKPLHIQNFINEVGKSGKSKSLQSKIKITLNAILKTAVINGLILNNPAQYVELYEVPSRTVEALTLPQIKTLLNLAVGTRAELAIHLGVFCGLRRGELTALKWSDIDLSGGKINITRAIEFQAGRPVEKEPKSKAGIRTVPIPGHLVEMLQKAKKTSIYVVPDTLGHQMSEISTKRLLEPLQKKTPFRWSYHVLRHTYATLIDLLGVSPKTCQYLMGHAQLSTTKNIYTHIREEHLTLATEKISGIFGLIPK